MVMKLSKVGTSALAIAFAGMATGAWANADVMRLQEDPGVVIQPSIHYNGWNYSGLDQVNTENVGDLVVKYTVALGVNDEYEAPPLVVNNHMYIITAEPNFVYKMDLETGAILWEFRPEFPAAELARAREMGCCGSQTRGLNYAEGKLFLQTLSGRVMALDADTGAKLWESQGADMYFGETLTGNGIVIGNLYITGSAGGERGVRGYVQAFDINNGDLIWKMYNMGPNNEVGIGPRFQPFYADDKIANPALASWKGDSWKRGGGTVWGYFTYDPELNLFYYSTGNCGPWNPDYRREWGQVDLDDAGGLITYRNNYCASQIARDATTGEMIWAYNMTPQDQWDLDEPLITPLVDLEINGQMRKVALKAARNGHFYVWDRATGEIVNDPWKFVAVDFAKGIDKETGRLLYDIDKMMFTHAADRQKYTKAGALTPEEIAVQAEEAKFLTPEQAAANLRKGTEVSWCPGIAARNWENDAFSPRTGLLYTSTQNRCQTLRMVEGKYELPMPATGYTLRENFGQPYQLDLDGNPTKVVSALQANDPVAGKTVWKVEFTQATRTPVMATAGDLVFMGNESNGSLEAYDARDGKLLWSFRTGTGFGVTPITYKGPDGQQYVAIIGSKAATDPAVAANAAPDNVNRYRRAGATLFVFGLHRSVASAN